MDLESISDVADTLWSEARRQARNELWERRKADEKAGRHTMFGYQDHTASTEAIFSRYKTLVQKYMVESRRPKTPIYSF